MTTRKKRWTGALKNGAVYVMVTLAGDVDVIDIYSVYYRRAPRSETLGLEWFADDAEAAFRYAFTLSTIHDCPVLWPELNHNDDYEDYIKELTGAEA